MLQDCIIRQQRGSEIQTSLVYGIKNGIKNQEAEPFEIRTNGLHFVNNHLKSGQKHPDFQWSGF